MRLQSSVAARHLWVKSTELAHWMRGEKKQSKKKMSEQTSAKTDTAQIAQIGVITVPHINRTFGLKDLKLSPLLDAAVSFHSVYLECHNISWI